MSELNNLDILAENDHAEDSLETLDEACGPRGKSVGSAGKKTVPQGWRLAENGKVVAPDGKIFKNRRLALREMIVSGLFSRTEVDLMRFCLKFEGWRHSQDIPAGWMTKQRNRKVLFVTSDGDIFESLAAAARFVEKYEKYYSQEDLEKIKKLHPMGKSKSIKKEKEAKLSTVDKVEVKKEKMVELPRGWQIKSCKGGGKIFISSSGEKLNGISSALRFLVKHNPAQEEINQLREYSSVLGWRADPGLPPHWLVKKGSKKTMYLGPSGEFFRTKEKMMRYLHSDPEKPKESKSQVKVENSPVKNVKKSSKKSSRTPDTWIPSDGTIPEGWKYKRSKDGNNHNLYLLTPEGKVIPGRRSALKFLVENNAAPEQILEMRNLLTDYDDWNTDSELPENWLYKVTKGKKKEISFCSPSGERFRQKEKAVQFLQNSGGPADDVAMLRAFSRSLTDTSSWSEGDGTIPAGWMIKESRIGDRSLTMLLSSCGKHIQGRRAALGFMIENLYPESSIAGMRRSLVQLDGWQEDSRLPHNWLMKNQSSRRLLLCSPVGKLFESREKAIKHLREMSGSEEDIMKLMEIPASAVKSNTTVSNQSTEEDDETEAGEEEIEPSEEDESHGTEEEEVLDVDSSLDQSTDDAGDISLETSSIESRGLAPLRKPTLSFKSKKLYKDFSVFLREEKFDSLVTVKAELSLLGWMEAPDLLPHNWLIRLKPGFTNINFLTPSGKTLKSLPHARKYVEENGVQFVFDFEKLKERLVSL